MLVKNYKMPGSKSYETIPPNRNQIGPTMGENKHVDGKRDRRADMTGPQGVFHSHICIK